MGRGIPPAPAVWVDMQRFTMEVAGCVGDVTAEFDSTKAYFTPYLTEKAADFAVTPGENDRAFEQQASIREALAEGIHPRQYTPPHLERAAILRSFAEFAFRRDILLLHGSCVALDGLGYLFTAPCGTGKSTHTRLWRQVYGERAVMVNDDKPFVSLREEGVWVSGSPWCGKHGLGSNITVPLAGVCILSRGGENRIFPLSPAEALTFLITQVYHPLDPEKDPLPLLEELAERIPLWHLTCQPTPAAAALAGETIHPDTK